MPKDSRVLPFLLAVLVPFAALAEQTLHHQEQPEGSPILAFYDFEQPQPSGPDTFWISPNIQGSVDLSAAFRVSGRHSLHIREIPGDRNFAEFLGYFRERRSDAVVVQFYVLFTDLDQKFNFGLAGSRWFLSLEQHGHAVWLETRQGKLWHRPANEWRELFAPIPFAWYFVDLVYDVERGTYDLAIYEEDREEPLLDLRRQRNTADADESSVRFYSFIGDLEDEGRFDYFVDDLLIATDPAVRLKPFVAPGRRHFFVKLYAGSRPRLAEAELEDLLWETRQWLRDSSAKALSDAVDLDRMERAGDEAFFRGDLDLAGEVYLRLRQDPRREQRILLKLSDVSFQQGDVDEERRLREAIYGALDFEELK